MLGRGRPYGAPNCCRSIGDKDAWQELPRVKVLSWSIRDTSTLATPVSNLRPIVAHHAKARREAFYKGADHRPQLSL